MDIDAYVETLALMICTSKLLISYDETFDFLRRNFDFLRRWCWYMVHGKTTAIWLRPTSKFAVLAISSYVNRPYRN